MNTLITLQYEFECNLLNVFFHLITIWLISAKLLDGNSVTNHRWTAIWLIRDFRRKPLCKKTLVFCFGFRICFHILTVTEGLL